MAITVQGEVFTWGLNIKGQLGLGDTENRSAPTRVDKVSKNSVNCTGSNLERSERPIDISAGALHSLLTTDRNRLFSCGHGGNYALCLNSNEDMTEFQHI